MMERLSRMFRPDRTPVDYEMAESSTSELREREGLQAELDRHGEFIERHVNAVSRRVREDAAEAERRVAGR